MQRGKGVSSTDRAGDIGQCTRKSKDGPLSYTAHANEPRTVPRLEGKI